MGRDWKYKTLWSLAHSEVTLFLRNINFRRIWFRDLRFRFWGLEIKHPKAHNFVWQGFFFLSLLSRNFDDQLSSNFHMFVVVCKCWDTPNEKSGLWQLPIVSSVFNIVILFFFHVTKTEYLTSRWREQIGLNKKKKKREKRGEKCSNVTTTFTLSILVKSIEKKNSISQFIPCINIGYIINVIIAWTSSRTV